jgi:hypothetical protein
MPMPLANSDVSVLIKLLDSFNEPDKFVMKFGSTLNALSSFVSVKLADSGVY